MTKSAAHFIFLFLDGVGLAAGGPTNPLTPFVPETNSLLKSPTPYLTERLGTPLLANLNKAEATLLAKPLDANLGVAGYPQSATGQTTLYTGRNAPEFLGRHLPGFANGSLRILIEESGLFRQVLQKGGRVTSANLYSDGYFAALEARKIRYSVGALLSLTSGVRFRMPEDYERGEALFWDITGRYLPERNLQLEQLSPYAAGTRLAGLANDHEVTLFECYLPDFAGHSRDIEQARQVLADVDGLIQGTLENMADNVTLVISSDHGNIEDISIKNHTRNPVPLLVFGPTAPAFVSAQSIMDITPLIVEQISQG